MSQKRFVFLSDIHAPLQLDECVALACEYLKRFGPDLLVLGGDIIDLISVSRFPSPEDAPGSVSVEIEATQKFVLEPITEAARKGGNTPRIVYLEGNHEFRLRSFMRIHARPLMRMLTLAEALQLPKYGIEYIESKKGNAQFKYGPVHFQHGERYGANPASLHLNDMGGHTIFGHTHRESHARKTFGSGVDWIALGAGCLCKPPDYRDISTQSYGFISGWIDEQEGTFDAHHQRIYVEKIGKAIKAKLFTREYGTISSQFDGKRQKCVVSYSK